nr:MAG TPA: hypothetical protein [Caudoviricetes sp.]
MGDNWEIIDRLKWYYGIRQGNVKTTHARRLNNSS